MFDAACLNKSLRPLQMFDDILVCVLDILANKVSDLGGKPANTIQRTDNLSVLLNDSMSKADTVVIFSKVRGLEKDFVFIKK